MMMGVQRHQDERSWQVGYVAGRSAKLAGKPTPRAPQDVDGFAYAAGAVEGAAAGERDRKDPRADLPQPSRASHYSS
jgi:hypothetical protein